MAGPASRTPATSPTYATFVITLVSQSEKCRSEEIPDRPQHGLRLLLSNGMARARDAHELRFRYRLFEGVAIDRRDQHVFLAPHDQGLGGDAIKPLRQAAIGDGEQQLARHAQP